MARTFTTATDDSLISLIKDARHRIAFIAPALTTPVAQALATRIGNLPALSLTIILDADAEVYRMGYGDPEALEIVRKACNEAKFEMRQQPGVRIGVLISVSVPEVQEGLQSLLNIIRIEARRKKAIAFRFRFSKSLARRRQRLSQPKVRSTTQRFGSTSKPCARSDRFTISIDRFGNTAATALLNFAPW